MRLFWQLVIVTLVLLGMAVAVATLEAPPAGTFGMRTTQGGLSDPGRVLDVQPGSPAAAAGIRVGDVITPLLTLANLIATAAPMAGDQVTLRDGPRTIVLTAAADTTQTPIFGIVILFVAKAAFLAIALLLIVRRADDPAARALAVFLGLYGAATASDPALVHSLWGRFALLLVLQSTFFFGLIAALVFACRFPQRAEHGVRRAIDRAIPAFAIAGAILADGGFIAAAVSPQRFGPYRHAESVAFVALFALTIAAIVVALWSSYREASPTDRVRVRWVLVTFGFGLSGLVLYVGATVVIPGTPWLQLLTLTVLAIPFGLGYVILRHRVLDIGFVVNRAVVYTGVSLVVVVTFIVFEWLAGHLVADNERASSLLQLAAALALGLSVRAIHTRVDRWVDNFFFRERHEAEAALRRFADEALLVTDARDLAVKTVETAQTRLHLTSCALYEREGARYIAVQSTIDGAPAVGENDYAVLEMRTWRAPVDLHDRRSTLPGELTLPMTVRGELTGFLLCGEKGSGESYAPDEREALAQLARSVGIALDSLRVRSLERRLRQIDAAATGGGKRMLEPEEI